MRANTQRWANDRKSVNTTTNSKFRYTFNKSVTGSPIWFSVNRICSKYGLPKPSCFTCLEKSKKKEDDGDYLEYTFQAACLDFKDPELLNTMIWERGTGERPIVLVRDTQQMHLLMFSVGEAFDVYVHYFMDEKKHLYVEFNPKISLTSVPILLLIAVSAGCSEEEIDRIFLDGIRDAFSETMLQECNDEDITGLIGLEESYETLDSILRMNLDLDLRKKCGLAKRNILLAGPPGCGKSLLLNSLCRKYREQSIQFFVRDTREFQSTVTFLTVISHVFKIGIIVIIDEVDEIAMRRDLRCTSTFEFLRLMDGVSKLPNVTFLATTNRPDMLDTALFRPERFDPVLMILWPATEARQKMFVQFMGRYVDLEKDGTLVRGMVEGTEGWSGAEIRAVIEDPVFKHRGDISKYSVAEVSSEIISRKKKVLRNHDSWAQILSYWSRNDVALISEPTGAEIGCPDAPPSVCEGKRSDGIKR